MRKSVTNSLRIAACYIRVSTDDQTELSPASQLVEIHKYAREHNFYIPEEHIYKDEGISGRNADKRPEFQRMIATAKKKPKPFEAVLLWKFSRFARNKTDAVVYKNMLRKDLGIDVISVSENVGEDAGTAVILESIFEAMDEYYSINLSTEVTRSMKMKAEKGEPNGPAPFGYLNDKEHKTYIPDPDRAGIVKYIFSSYASGVGMRSLASELNAKGIRTKRGNLIDNRFIEYMLMNPVYTGKTRWTVGRQNSRERYKNGADEDTILAQGTHTPLIEPELFEAVKLRLTEQKQKYGKYQRPEVPKEWMLRGLMRCNSCGSTLIRISTKSPSMQCHSYAKGQCHISHSLSLNKANELVIQSLETAAMNLTFEVEPRQATQKMLSDSAVIKQAIESEKKKLEKVKEAYAAGIDTLEEYKENKTRILKTIEQLTQKLEDEEPEELPDKESYSKRILDVVDILKDSEKSELEKNEALRSIVSKIVFEKPDNILTIHFYA